MTNKKIKIRLQGHEKFVLREGWLNKGIVQVKKNATVFLGKEGPDVFGIGNNMVKSLRYWLKAFGLIVEKYMCFSTKSLNRWFDVRHFQAKIKTHKVGG